MTFFKSYWKSIFVAIVIIYLSLLKQPPFKVLPPIPNTDKLVHLIMYFGLAAVFFVDLWVSKTKQWKLHVFTLLFPILLGGIIEILQENFFPPRTGDWLDWVADICGVLLGYIIGILLYRIKQTS